MAIIQFRVEKINVECFHQARRLLGDAVPDIKLLKDEELEKDEIHTYFMTCIPGKTWLESYQFDQWEPSLNVVATKSLGEILSRGQASGDSVSAVDEKVKPKLQALLSSSRPEVVTFQPDIQNLLDRSDRLKALPLWIFHADLNHVNILVHPTGQVSGIVDWESAENLPFGIGLNRIITLAGRYRNRKFHQPDEFEEAERAFWTAILNGLPPTQLTEQAEAIQTAVRIGELLDTLDLSAEVFNKVALNSLSLLLTYKPAIIRGEDERPFAVL